MKKEGCRYVSQGGARLQFQQKVKQMLNYEFEGCNSFMSYQYLPITSCKLQKSQWNSLEFWEG